MHTSLAKRKSEVKLTSQNIQIIKQDNKGAEFSGSAPITWLGTLTSAMLSITASSKIEEMQFNDLIARPNTSTYSVDVTSSVKQGDNFLRVKVEYNVFDVIWGTTKTVNAVVSIVFEGIGGGLSIGAFQDILSKLNIFGGEVKGWSQWILIGIFVIAIIIAVAYLVTSIYGGGKMSSFKIPSVLSGEK